MLKLLMSEMLIAYRISEHPKVAKLERLFDIDKNLKLYLLIGTLVVNRDSKRELSAQSESDEGLVRVLGKLELL